MISVKMLTLALTYKLETELNDFEQASDKLSSELADKIKSDNFNSYLCIVTKEVTTNISKQYPEVKYLIAMFVTYDDSEVDLVSKIKEYIELELSAMDNTVLTYCRVY